MDRYRAATAMQDHGGDADDPDELGVFAAERYFYGEDALWCERSWSSLSSAFRTGTLELDHDRSVPTPTAATSSSEASWNSRSALLPNEPAEKLGFAAATPIVGAGPGPSLQESGRIDRRPASSCSLRRWLLGVAGCACAGAGGGAGEESVSGDEMESVSGNGVPGISGKKCNAEARELFHPDTENPQATAARVSHGGSSRWLLGGDIVLAAGEEALSPGEVTGDGHRRAANQCELSSLILHPEAAATSKGSALCSAAQNSAVTVVAGSTALGGGSGGGNPGDPRDSGEDDAARSELGCAYPPSEASVVWSVVTADGAASGNFSSAASGYCYHYYFDNGEDGVLRRAAARSSQRRRAGMASSSSLLTCLSEKAVEAVGPARSIHRQEVEPPAAMVTLGAHGGSRNGHGGGYHDVVRRQ